MDPLHLIKHSTNSMVSLTKEQEPRSHCKVDLVNDNVKTRDAPKDPPCRNSLLERYGSQSTIPKLPNSESKK